MAEGSPLLVTYGGKHGLAFASALTGFGFDRASLWLTVLGFNLGVEAMQLAVVAVAMPAFLLLSRSRAYPRIRIAGAAIGIVAAVIWIAQRAAGS